MDDCVKVLENVHPLQIILYTVTRFFIAIIFILRKIIINLLTNKQVIQ